MDKNPVTLRPAGRFRFRPVGPYNFELTVHKPAGWSWFTPFERWEGGTIWTGFWIALPGGAEADRFPVGVRARASESMVTADVFASRKLDRAALTRLRDLLGGSLGIGEDLRPFYRLMRNHPVLKHLARRLHGMHEGWGMNVFSSLTLAVLLQMAPIRRSQNMWDCLIRGYGREVRFDGRSVRLWPDEGTVARAKPAALARKCRVGYRARFLVRLAGQLARGFPDAVELAAMEPSEAERRLMGLYGIGEYSAGFASPHPSFSLDSWSVRIFHRLIFGKRVPAGDPRRAIAKTTRAAERMWGEWRGLVLVYVLNDLPYLDRTFGIPSA